MASRAILGTKTNSEIDHYLHLLKAAKVSCEKIVVFGSRARGTNHSESDIDLCIVSNRFGKDPHGDRVNLMHIRDNLSINIEPHPMSPEDYNSKWHPLAHEIRTHGIEIKV